MDPPPIKDYHQHKPTTTYSTTLHPDSRQATSMKEGDNDHHHHPHHHRCNHYFPTHHRRDFLHSFSEQPQQYHYYNNNYHQESDNQTNEHPINSSGCQHPRLSFSSNLPSSSPSKALTSIPFQLGIQKFSSNSSNLYSNKTMDRYNTSTPPPDADSFTESMTKVHSIMMDDNSSTASSTESGGGGGGQLKVSWYNLTYTVDCGSSVDPRETLHPSPSSSSQEKVPFKRQWSLNGFRKNRSVILNGLTGQFKSGELTAIMGPSGCGKTTLLECLAGKRQTGVSGDISFSGCKDVKVSFISQQDHLLSHLTVRESLLFASKLKNHDNSSSSSHVKASSSLTSGSSKTDDSLTDDKRKQVEGGIFTLDVVPNDKIHVKRNTSSFSNRKKRDNISGRKKQTFDHESIVQKLLDQFGLNVCADVRVSNCSGGQLKRLSIAQELVSKPNLLILDEPTSGLDSASCFQCIELLQQLTLARNNGSSSEEPLAVVATIHQPSARVFNMFQKVFFLSTTGRCIYEGPPGDLVPMLSSVGLVCPAFNNPADYMLEIASGEYGIEYIHKLADATDARKNNDHRHHHAVHGESDSGVVDEIVVEVINPQQHDDDHPHHHQLKKKRGSTSPSTVSTTTSSSASSITSDSPSSSVSDNIHSLHKRLNDRKHLPFFNHINLLFHRTVLSIIRDPMLTAVRFMSHIIVAIFIGLLYGSKIGTASGCPPAYSSIENVQLIQKHVYEDIIASSENVANLFFAAMFIMYGAMLPTVLTFPTELNVFLKERSNGWYHSRTYYLAKTMADVPMQFIFPIIYGAIIYLMTSQVWSVWRFSMFLLILILTGLSAQSHGLLVSALFVHDPNVAVYAGPMTTIPFLLFAGFFVRIRTMPPYLVGLSYISYVRYAFEAMISIIYGFDRCLVTPLEVPNDPTGNSGSALFKFLSILFSPDYDQSGSDEYDDVVNGTIASTAPSIGSVGSDGSFSPSKGLIESIVKDFQANNPFFGDVFSPDRNSTSSYVMKQFDLTEYSLYLNIMRLLIVFVAFRIGAYLLLMWKADRKR